MNASPWPGRATISQCRGPAWCRASGADHDTHIRYVGDDGIMWVAIGQIEGANGRPVLRIFVSHRHSDPETSPEATVVVCVQEAPELAAFLRVLGHAQLAELVDRALLIVETARQAARP